MFKEGQLLYLLDAKGERHWLRAANGMVKVGGLGVIDGAKLLAAEDGGKITLAGRSFTVLLPGRRELMEGVERNSQVITPKDAGTILLDLDLKCGDVVLEAGVGSGALTMAMVSSVAPNGKVVSMELRDDFAQKAKRNIENAGLIDFWQLSIGDVRKHRIEITADAAILDMPDPWEAVPNVLSMLRCGGRLCCYIPNANQLELTVKAMRQAGMAEVRALENIQRAMEVHEAGVRPSYETLGHTGYLAFGRKVC
jgi:tRNA (adenine57-N1/adenine58-N1)-methyltransferase